ncbi:radical SAM additional 4Fe4S-binding SPASM domain-containing protein [Lutibacter oricola]|uniref:Radical SAM additional 4Fe4S-binding SPASM domain-containing protein n=1 Tax=Lutibacter oricola TaxID=762486 RepID=A0A1H2REN9_9FLAO|nr:radical SAM protein [Lutibacter oricola]SDW17765.1 radical SAM additional 4Fe4S-binding SPASM domain-containing protein [Lutibacter oricola]
MNKRRLKKALRRIKYLPRNKYLVLYLINKVKHFYFKITKSHKVAYPSTIMLELTNLCNLACTTCPREYTYGKQMNTGLMDINQAKKIIDQLWPYLDSIGLTGMGETFMYNEIEEVVDYIKRKNKGIIISVSTNAVLPSFIKRASKIINKIDTVQISIDGLNEVYEKIRLNATFSKLDENLRKLKELCKGSNTTLMLNMVVTKENYFQMPNLVDYADEVGIDFLDFTLFNLASVTNIDRSYYQFYKSKEFLEALGLLEDKIKNKPSVYVTNRNFKTDNGFKKCIFPWSHFYVSWDGYVPPCCAKPFPKELNFGNVFNKNIMSILNNKSMIDWRKLWFKNETPNFCDKCHLIDIEPVKKSTENS